MNRIPVFQQAHVWDKDLRPSLSLFNTGVSATQKKHFDTEEKRDLVSNKRTSP